MPNPVVWHIYPSNICMLDCSFCIMKEEKKRFPSIMLSKETFQKVPKDAFKHNIKLVHFSGGGEPLTNPYTREIAKKMGTYNIKTALSTNGILLQPTDAQIFDNIRISIDAGHSLTYTKIKNKPYFDVVIQNVSELIKAKQKYNYKADIGLGFVITLDNFDEIIKFRDLGIELQADFIHFRPCYYNNKKQKNELKKIIENYKFEEKNSPTQQYFITYKIKEKHFSNCLATPLQAVLSATGEFIVCQDVFIRWGNYNTQSFNEIWFGKEHFKAIKKINISICPRCVEGFHNEVIENMFLKNNCRNELI